MDCAADWGVLLTRLVERADAGIPVLSSTVAELKQMERAQDRIAGNALAGAILRDPLMTLAVLRFLHGHRTRSQTVDITTIAHAIMMLGQARFFREFGVLHVVEDRLRGHAAVIEAVHQAASTARLASLFARDWALARHDLDPEEVMVAALVHDVTEMLIAVEWPDKPIPLEPQAQAQLRTGLFRRLGIPGLVTELTEDGDTHSPRVLNVRLACRLARRCAHGWRDAAIADDLADVQRLLHVSAPELWERVRKVVLQAAREWRFYEVRPAAMYLAQAAG